MLGQVKNNWVRRIIKNIYIFHFTSGFVHELHVYLKAYQHSPPNQVINGQSQQTIEASRTRNSKVIYSGRLFDVRTGRPVVGEGYEYNSWQFSFVVCTYCPGIGPYPFHHASSIKTFICQQISVVFRHRKAPIKGTPCSITRFNTESYWICYTYRLHIDTGQDTNMVGGQVLYQMTSVKIVSLNLGPYVVWYCRSRNYVHQNN